MMSVNTLGEVPDANGYIVEIGVDSAHPAASIDDDRIRERMELGEWYIRTANSSEEIDLMSQVDARIDHTRLPAYLILNSHPREAEEAVVVYLDGTETKDEAVEVLEQALVGLHEVATEDSEIDLSELAEHLTARSALFALGVGADSITHLQFFGL